MRRAITTFLACMFLACSSGPEGTADGDCADGKDNDSNGFIDCEDKGCNLDDHCISIAAEAKLAAEEAEEAKKAEQDAERQKLEEAEASADHIQEGGIWIQKVHNGEDVNRHVAQKYCEDLVLSGKDDWRLPTRAEAVAIAGSPRIMKEPLVMWTKEETGKKSGIIVGISSGAVNEIGLNSKGQCRARCVRDNN